MALPHAHPLDVIDVRPLAAGISSAVSTSLLKTASLQLIRLVLPAGHGMPEHGVTGAVTIHCIEGHAVVTTPSRRSELQAGQLVMLEGGDRHDVRALADSSLLVTIVLQPPA
jgi:quercetin dioxygenase-like cupin family protein